LVEPSGAVRELFLPVAGGLSGAKAGAETATEIEQAGRSRIHRRRGDGRLRRAALKDDADRALHVALSWGLTWHAAQTRELQTAR
jgi:hypothetical protein